MRRESQRRIFLRKIFSKFFSKEEHFSLFKRLIVSSANPIEKYRMIKKYLNVVRI